MSLTGAGRVSTGDSPCADGGKWPH